MPTNLSLFALGQRGNDLVNKPQDLDGSELIASQNAEIISGGEGALDQRPGMSRIGSSGPGAPTTLAFDVPSNLLTDHTAYLYAAFASGSAANWRKSVDGITWSNDSTLSKILQMPTLPIVYYKNWTKAVTLDRYLYFFDNNTPINIHRWDGVTDLTLASIPPSVAGTSLQPVTALVSNNDSNTVNFVLYSASGCSTQTTSGSTSYTYKFVTTAGSANSAPTTGYTLSDLPASLSSTGYFKIDLGLLTAPPAGATAIDVYRTAGGATQGKIGSIPIVSGAFTNGNGSGLCGWVFSDAGLVGDGNAVPTGASAVAAANAFSVLDLTTDGSSLYTAVIDVVSGNSSAGRILQFNPTADAWTQILGEFPVTASQGTAGTLINYDGAMSYGTMVDVATGSICSTTTTHVPNYVGGVPENHTGVANLVPVCMQPFAGALFVGTAVNSGTGAALVVKRLPLTATGTWSTSLTASATGAQNAYTSITTFNGRIFTGWTSGDGSTAALIKSSPDGVTWTTEYTANTTDVPCQMVVFKGSLYVVMGSTGVSYNTTSYILQRTAAGTWTVVDDPSDALAGALGIVYV